MWISFCIALGIVIFGVVNYDKMSYKANYYRNKKNDIGYYWGGIPRNQKTVDNEIDDWKEIR